MLWMVVVVLMVSKFRSVFIIVSILQVHTSNLREPGKRRGAIRKRIAGANSAALSWADVNTLPTSCTFSC